MSLRYLASGVVIIFAASVAVQFFAIQLPEEKSPSDVAIAVDFGSKITADTVNAKSAFDAINNTHVVEYREYANGYFVTSIDNVSQNATHSWGYFVNGMLPLMSADSYAVKYGDNVTFAFMENERFYKYFGK